MLISSIGGVIGIPFQAYYSASKFALEGFAESVAYEVAPFGVAVTLVQPGNIATDFTASRVIAATAAADGAYAAAMTQGSRRLWSGTSAMVRPAAQSPPRCSASCRPVSPPRRVSVGKASERAGIVAKRVLPFRLFEAAAKGSLGVALRPVPLLRSDAAGLHSRDDSDRRLTSPAPAAARR